MDKGELELINQVFKSREWLRLIQHISDQPDSSYAKGSIEIDTKKDILFIDVFVSEDFPLGNIEFICKNVNGYSHEMLSGLLCLKASPAATIEDRLLLELEKLKKWVDDYYIKEKIDSHFEYYNFNQTFNVNLIFEESREKPPLKSSYGRFFYSMLQQHGIEGKSMKTWVALDLGGRKCRWSKSFLNTITEKFIGLWVYSERPPLIERRQTITNWKDLLEVLTPSQTKYLYDEQKKVMNESAFAKGFLLMLGYDIPSENGVEIHWESIFVPFDPFPFASKKVALGVYEPVDLGYNVNWCRSHNSSYERMFGRGKLSDHMTENKILIIGTGAIGSSLLEALVRGGCRFIDINDGDTIEPGNNCRGKFSFKESFYPKILELYNSSIAISPYVEINYGNDIKPIRKVNKKYTELRKKLSSYDLIFDCTTDKYLSIMLDEMNLHNTIVNLSITNEAKHLVAITGTGNIHRIKNTLYNRLSPGKGEIFHIATGCWSPTFKASFTDINILLSYAINQINHHIESQISISSFYIEVQKNTTGILQYKINFNV